MAWYNFFSDAPSKAIDLVSDISGGVMAGLDKLVLTKEEKADIQREAMKIWLEVQKVTAGESSIRSVTRRMLAVAFIAVYLLHIVGGSIVYQFNKEYAAHLFKTAGSLNTVVMTIVIFYFGYYAVNSMISKVKGK